MTKTLYIIDPAKHTPEIPCYQKICGHFPGNTEYLLPNFGHDLQKIDLDEIGGLVILGSGYHVYENPPWQTDLQNLILATAERNVAVLGICYGHQLIAHSYGCELGDMYLNKKQFSGMRKIQVFSESIFQPRKLNVLMSHQQVVCALSSSLRVIASSSLHPFEMLQHKKLPIYTIQGHPEASDNFKKTRDLEISMAPLAFSIVDEFLNSAITLLNKSRTNIS